MIIEWLEEKYDEFEFELGNKWRWLICHMSKEPPYKIKYRLIWTPSYKTTIPEKFIDIAQQELLH